MKSLRTIGLLLFVGVCIVLAVLTVQLAFEEARATSSSAGQSFLANVESSPTPPPTEVGPTEAPTPGPSPTFDSSSTGDF